MLHRSATAQVTVHRRAYKGVIAAYLFLHLICFHSDNKNAGNDFRISKAALRLFLKVTSSLISYKYNKQNDKPGYVVGQSSV